MPTYSLRLTTPRERGTTSHSSGSSVTVNYNGRVYETRLTAWHILGYIPGISVITGLFHLMIGMCALCIKPGWANLQISRGILQICCLGILFLPCDAGCCKLERD